MTNPWLMDAEFERPSTRAATGSAFVSAHDLGRLYAPATVALRRVSFQIHPGDTVSISGPSGSGKSTLLSILGLLDTPTSGAFLLDGEDVTRLDERERTAIRRTSLGFVFQAFHLIPHLSAVENVEYALDSVRPQERREVAEDSLERLGLSSRLAARPPTMSGGEQQRVAIARALARRPRLLLCDEPTGNLDSRSSAQVLDALFENATDAGALVIVTHDVGVAQRCARHLVMSDGELHEAGHV